MYVLHSSKRIIIFQLVFHLRWMQFSQHSEAIPLYHGYSNPIGRAVEIPRMSIYMPSLHPAYLPGDQINISAVNKTFNLLRNSNNYTLYYNIIRNSDQFFCKYIRIRL